MQTIAAFKPGKAAGFGVLLSAVNPKNLLLALGALYFALGERSNHILDELKTWMGAHNAAIIAALCLFLGAKLIGDAISGFAA